MSDDGAPEFGNDKAVAVLLLSIDQEIAAKVLRNFSDDALDRVAHAMKELQEIAIDRGVVHKVYEGAVARLKQGGMALGDVSGVMRTLLMRALGDEKGSEVTARVSQDILQKRPFAMFDALPAEDILGLLHEEHPQIAAVFLAHLDRKKAGDVLRLLDDEVRADYVHRVATLAHTPADAVQRVLEVMRKKVKSLGLSAKRSEPKAWVRTAAALLNNLGGGEKSVIEKIEQSDADTAQAIRDEMFTFEDLAALDKKSMQKILASVDSRQIAVSLKAATPAVEQSILGSLSKRAADMVREERDSLGPMPLTEVVQAQIEILKLIRDMIDKGDIKAGGAEQMV